MAESLSDLRYATQELVYYDSEVVDRCREALDGVTDHEIITSQTVGVLITPRSFSERFRAGWRKSENWVGIFLSNPTPVEVDEAELSSPKDVLGVKADTPMYDFLEEFYRFNRELVDILEAGITAIGTGDEDHRDLAFMTYAESLILRSALYNSLFTTTPESFKSSQKF